MSSSSIYSVNNQKLFNVTPVSSAFYELHSLGDVEDIYVSVFICEHAMIWRELNYRNEAALSQSVFVV